MTVRKIVAGFSFAALCLSLYAAVLNVAVASMSSSPVIQTQALNNLVLNVLCVVVNVCVISLNSPGYDPTYYPRAAIRRLRGRLRRSAEARARAALEARPAFRAWDAILQPPHGISPSRAGRLSDLRTRAMTMSQALTGSIEIADIDALLLLEKTVGELSAAYRDAAAMTTDPAERSQLDRRLDDALERMVAAAESRRAARVKDTGDRFDAAVSHALSSSSRLTD